MQITHSSNFSGTEARRRLAKRRSPATPARGLQLMMSVVSPQKITKGNMVLEMIEKWETIILALERDFNEQLSERMKASDLLNMMPVDIQNSLIRQADKLEHSKMTKERVVSIMEAKNALHPDATVCNRCGGKGHFARIAGRLLPEVRARARARARTARVALNNRPRGVPGTPSFASTATRKDTLRRTSGRRNVRRTVTGQRTKLTRVLAK